MFGSVLLIIYTLFIIIYCAVMGYAVYRVWLFGQYKVLAGSSVLISICYAVLVVGVIFFTFIGISRYRWDDSTAFYLNKIIGTTKGNQNSLQFPEAGGAND